MPIDLEKEKQKRRRDRQYKLISDNIGEILERVEHGETVSLETFAPSRIRAKLKSKAEQRRLENKQKL